MKKNILIFFLILAVNSIAIEYNVDNLPNPKLLSNTFVSNPDIIISQSTVDNINQMLKNLEKQNGTQVAVVLVNSIGINEIKSFATDLFKKWGIGDKYNNNGLLILFVLDQRKVTFETGYGLEGVLPDAICKRIQQTEMIPEFKNGNIDAGITNGIQAVIQTVKGERFEKKSTQIAWSEILPYGIGAYLVVVLLVFIWINSIIEKIKRNTQLNSNIARYKAIKSEKSGIILLTSIVLPLVAFVAVLLLHLPLYLLLLIVGLPFCTIPANIYARTIMYKVRREPIVCNECGGKMHILSEKHEDAHLKLSQQFEEQLHAIDYDVFVCDSCANEAIFILDKPSIYSDCPKCGTKAFILKDKRTIVAPTYISAGTERITYHCKFCGYEKNDNHNIPRLIRNGGAFVGGAAAGSIFSGRGGFGGGGFSGGGSFGGGFSGGGGATSGW